MVLRARIALIGAAMNPLAGFRGFFRNAQAQGIHQSEIILGEGVPLLRRVAKTLQRAGKSFLVLWLGTMKDSAIILGFEFFVLHPLTADRFARGAWGE